MHSPIGSVQRRPLFGREYPKGQPTSRCGPARNQRRLSKYYHPLAQTVLRVLRASGTGIEDEALVLCTAIEGLIKSHFASLLKPPSGERQTSSANPRDSRPASVTRVSVRAFTGTLTETGACSKCTGPIGP